MDSASQPEKDPPLDASLARMVFAPLRPDLIFQRQEFKNEIYYVIKDPLALTYFRIKPPEAYLLTLLDGKRTLREIWDLFIAEYPNTAYEPQAIANFCNQLARSGLLVINARSFVKFATQKPKAMGGGLLMFWMKLVSKLFFIKVPLVDPSAWLGKVTHAVRFIWTRPFVVSCLVFYTFTLAWVYAHREAFAHNSINFFSPYNLFLVTLTVVIIKTFHEFGHAMTCRHFGGEVHEMGVCCICFIPCGYVNASDAWMMRHQRHKIYVTLAGVFTEFMIASIAAYVWLNIAEGLLKNLAFDAMVVASVNTLFFNMNPLMRFDGYYVISDVLEIPNLRSKAMMYCSYHMQRFLLGYKNMMQARMLEHEPRGRVFIIYAIAAYIYMAMVIYRLSQMFANFLEKYELKDFGLVIGVAAQVSFLLFPVMRIFYDAFKPGAHIVPLEPIWRRLSKWIAGVGMIVGILFLIPVHFKVETQGIVVSTYGESITSVTPGVLQELFVKTGSTVEAGAVVGRLYNEAVWAQFEEAKVDLALARLTDDVYLAEHHPDVQLSLPALLMQEEEAIAAYEQSLHEVRGLSLVTTMPGVVLTQDVHNELGRYFNTKETVLRIAALGQFTLIIPITEEQVSMLEEGSLVRGRFVGSGDVVRTKVDIITSQRAQQAEHYVALLENFGGPVSAQLNSEDQIAYTPIFFGEASLDGVDAYLCEGMRVHLTVTGLRTTVAQKLYRKFLNMWNLRGPVTNPFAQT
jgi:putative peptide zinc metalloprotease protein